MSPYENTRPAPENWDPAQPDWSLLSLTVAARKWLDTRPDVDIDAVLDGLIFDAGHLLCEGAGGPTWELIPVRRPTQTLRWAGRYYRGAGVGLVDALELIPARRPCPCEVCS